MRTASPQASLLSERRQAPMPPSAEAAQNFTSAPNKSKEYAALVQRLNQQRDAVFKRERELAELQHKLAEQERSMSELCRETGARKQRINVNTLKGTPSVRQVGHEMAHAIRRRQVRRKEHLRDKVNKLTAKLGEKLAKNRELRAEIDMRRRARLYHLAAVREGGAEVARSETEINGLIMAAQRAYAEKETIVLKLGDLKRRANEESITYVREMDLCETQMEELGASCCTARR